MQVSTSVREGMVMATSNRTYTNLKEDSTNNSRTPDAGYQPTPTNRGGQNNAPPPKQQQAKDEDEGWGNDDLLPD